MKVSFIVSRSSFQPLFLYLLALAASADSCISGFSNAEDIMSQASDIGSEAKIQYIPPSIEANSNYQLIFPGLKFHCTGYITAWSALTVLDIRVVRPRTLMHQINLQVWRPSVERTTYHLVGSNKMVFSYTELRSVFQLNNSSFMAFFKFQNKSEVGKQIYFQPGDVIGCLIPPHYRTIVPSLSPVLTMSMNTSAANNMYSLITEEQYCDLSQCSNHESFAVWNNVLPQISLGYGMIAKLTLRKHA